jgi:hypothetical protein
MSNMEYSYVLDVGTEAFQASKDRVRPLALSHVAEDLIWHEFAYQVQW